MGKYSPDNVQALYGPHLITGNTLVELMLAGQYCKHPVYPYDGCYVFCISPISSGTVIFPVVGTRMIFDPLTMSELKYPMEERYYTLISIIPIVYTSIHIWFHMMVGIGTHIRKQMMMRKLLGLPITHGLYPSVW